MSVELWIKNQNCDQAGRVIAYRPESENDWTRFCFDTLEEAVNHFAGLRRSGEEEQGVNGLYKVRTAGNAWSVLARLPLTTANDWLIGWLERQIDKGEQAANRGEGISDYNAGILRGYHNVLMYLHNQRYNAQQEANDGQKTDPTGA